MSVKEAHRSARARIARETLAACEQGSYVAPSGRTVDVRSELARATESTICTDAAPSFTTFGADAAIELANETTLTGLETLAASGEAHLGCLNFASARNPGGGFQNGAQAQEESLARSSGLYPCLLTQKASFYDPNRAHRSALYLDRTIVSPLVPFFRRDDGTWLETPYLATVITSPAPNLGALREHRSADVARVPETLRRRADLVLALAAAHGVRRLVLGAWGCGVFRNEPTVVATVFADLLRDRFRSAFDLVRFSVYDTQPGLPVFTPFASAFRS
jgi:uncharacterized protein (TIGR02452 family)